MNRIAVIGNGGGGKSTLARRLCETLGLPYHEVDAFQWASDWTAKSAADYDEAHDSVLTGKRWLLDGFGTWPSIERRFAAADTIILVDLPLWVHFWLAAERQIDWHQNRGAGKPGGHVRPPPTKDLFEMIWRIDRDELGRLRAMVDAAQGAHRQVFRLKALEELESFVARLECRNCLGFGKKEIPAKGRPCNL